MTLSAGSVRSRSDAIPKLTTLEAKTLETEVPASAAKRMISRYADTGALIALERGRERASRLLRLVHVGAAAAKALYAHRMM